jgi:hypothetical protein
MSNTIGTSGGKILVGLRNLRPRLFVFTGHFELTHTVMLERHRNGSMPDHIGPDRSLRPRRRWSSFQVQS